MKLGWKFLLVATLVAIAGTGLWRWAHRSFIIRDSGYHQLLSGFHQALPKEKSLDGWDFQVKIPEKQLSVWVRAASQPGVARIQYENDQTETELYSYSDYSAPIEIKLAGHSLYVHWHEPLFGPTHKIIAYDLVARREITQRRIDPNDLRQSK